MRAGASLGSQLLLESNENPSGFEIAGAACAPHTPSLTPAQLQQAAGESTGRELVCEERGRALAAIKHSLRTRCSGEMGCTYGWISSSGGVVVAHNIVPGHLD